MDGLHRRPARRTTGDRDRGEAGSSEPRAARQCRAAPALAHHSAQQNGSAVGPADLDDAAVGDAGHAARTVRPPGAAHRAARGPASAYVGAWLQPAPTYEASVAAK